MPAQWKLYIALGAIVMAFAAGFYTEYKFTQASLEKQTSERLNKVNTGVTRIVQFNQEYDNAKKGDNCVDRAIPARMRHLLR